MFLTGVYSTVSLVGGKRNRRAESGWQKWSPSGVFLTRLRSAQYSTQFVFRPFLPLRQATSCTRKWKTCTIQHFRKIELALNHANRIVLNFILENVVMAAVMVNAILKLDNGCYLAGFSAKLIGRSHWGWNIGKDTPSKRNASSWSKTWPSDANIFVRSQIARVNQSPETTP